MPTVTVSPSEARQTGVLDDEAIVVAVAESRDEEAERLDP
jgi:hypothetical protein